MVILPKQFWVFVLGFEIKVWKILMYKILGLAQETRVGV